MNWFILSCMTGPYNVVGSVSKCRSRVRNFESQLSHITFVKTDHELSFTVILLRLDRLNSADWGINSELYLIKSQDVMMCYDCLRYPK